MPTFPTRFQLLLAPHCFKNYMIPSLLSVHGSFKLTFIYTGPVNHDTRAFSRPRLHAIRCTYQGDTPRAQQFRPAHPRTRNQYNPFAARDSPAAGTLAAAGRQRRGPDTERQRTPLGRGSRVAATFPAREAAVVAGRSAASFGRRGGRPAAHVQHAGGRRRTTKVGRAGIDKDRLAQYQHPPSPPPPQSDAPPPTRTTAGPSS
jgi:hypothetical protein